MIPAAKDADAAGVNYNTANAFAFSYIHEQFTCEA